MPRTVITGAAGFIGSHLSETLLDRGHTVVGFDNLLTGDTANVAHLTGRDFTLVKHDVTNYINVDGPVDYVLQLDFADSAGFDAYKQHAAHRQFIEDQARECVADTTRAQFEVT